MVSVRDGDEGDDNVDALMQSYPNTRSATFKGRLQLDSFRYTAPVPPTTNHASSSPHQQLKTNPSPKTSSQKASKDTFTGKRKRPNEPSTPSPAKRPRPSKTPAKKGGKTKTTAATYAHLPLLPDALGPNLLILFIGLNPGVETARTGHAYAHPSNLFWKLLFSSGITPRLCRAEEDRDMPALYSLGLTNIVARPSRSGAELAPAELDAGVALLEEKARRWRPEVVCVVGKGIWESIWRVRHACPVGRQFRYGWQDDSENMGVVGGEWSGASVFVATSTSGLAASLSPAEKQAIWAQLGSWVQTRRAERQKTHRWR